MTAVPAVHRYNGGGPPVVGSAAVATEAATLVAALKTELQAALDNADVHGHYDTHLALRQLKRLVRFAGALHSNAGARVCGPILPRGARRCSTPC
jgi:hypothetical protein